MPCISIIIPVYNAQRYLRVCLDSILGQTFSNWECVCVDDGSKDGSGDILDDYAKGDHRFKVVHQANAGVWAARNVALKLARGEWVTFVDSDDVLNPHWFEEGVRIVAETNVDLIRLDYFHGKQMPTGFMDRRGGDYFVKDGVAASAWMWSTMTLKGFLWCCFVRRDLTNALWFLPVINCKEDSIWLLELTFRVRRVAQGDFAGYYYRRTEGSLIRRNRKASQCVAYLEALQSLWNRNQQDAGEGGYLDVVRANIRAAADNDVVEWVMMRASEDDAPQKKVVEAYGELKSAGAFEGTKYTHRWRYWLGFIWWRLTGQVWMMRIPGVFFLYLRMMLNRLKR